MDTIQIDLNDLEEFVRAHIQSPDSQMNIQAQDKLEKLVDDVESNTLRYMKYFYEACDTEQPEKDDDFNMENSLVAKDAINRWHARRQIEGQLGEAAGQVPAIPLRMKNDWEVRFKPREEAKVMKLREITSNYVGSLVKLDCLVVRISQVKPKVEVVTYTCDICGA